MFCFLLMYKLKSQQCFHTCLYLSPPRVSSRGVAGEVEQEEPVPAGVQPRWRRPDLGQKSERTTLFTWATLSCTCVCECCECFWDFSFSEQKPNTAAEYVAAHLSKIHGLDWHPDNEFILATSSQDNSVRVRTTNRLLVNQRDKLDGIRSQTCSD